MPNLDRLIVMLLFGVTMAPSAARGQAALARPTPLPVLVTLTINSTRPLQMSKKQPIKEVLNEKDNILRVSKGSNERTVLVTGLAYGLSRVTFTAADGTVEILDVIVQIDLDLLQKLLERVVPTAVVKPIAVGNTIILTGTVASAEDIDIIIGITKGFTGGGAGTPVVNAMGPRR